MFKKIIVAFVIVISFSGCLKNKEQKCTYDSCAYSAPASEIQAIQNYLTSHNITNAVQHCSGLFYVIDTLGTGDQPASCSLVTVNYVGSLVDGTVFDHGTDFTIGLNQVIAGWTNGVPLIKEGGKIHLYIPPSLGYGSQPYGSIPGNSILIFDIHLTTAY